MQVSGQLHAPAALSPEKKAQCLLHWRQSGLCKRSGRSREKKIYWTHPDSNPNLVARSQGTVPTKLSAETLTASLNVSRDNGIYCSRVKNAISRVWKTKHIENCGLSIMRSYEDMHLIATWIMYKAFVCTCRAGTTPNAPPTHTDRL